MNFKLKVKMDNAAFEDDPGGEVARILRAVAEKVEHHPHFSPGHSQPVRDYNGNEVGHFDVYGG